MGCPALALIYLGCPSSAWSWLCSRCLGGSVGGFGGHPGLVCSKCPFRWLFGALTLYVALDFCYYKSARALMVCYKSAKRVDVCGLLQVISRKRGCFWVVTRVDVSAIRVDAF
ncbi:hypothetical protein U1Q18_004888 [Sarracenia purpurea var. burkii]